MEEDKKIIDGEDENLNSTETQEDNNSDWVQTTFSAEEVEEIKKKMQSDSEKWVQKLLSKTKAYEQTFDYLSKVADSPEELVKLHSDKPEVAEIILNKYYEWQSIEEYKKSISYKEDTQSPEYIEKLVEEKALKLSEEKEVKKSTTDFIKKLELSEDEEKEFLEILEERKWLKSYKNSDIQKHLEKSYFEIVDTDKLEEYKRNKSIWKSTSKSVGKVSWKKSNDAKKEELDNEIDAFMKKHNQI